MIASFLHNQERYIFPSEESRYSEDKGWKKVECKNKRVSYGFRIGVVRIFTFFIPHSVMPKVLYPWCTNYTNAVQLDIADYGMMHTGEKFCIVNALIREKRVRHLPFTSIERMVGMFFATCYTVATLGLAVILSERVRDLFKGRQVVSILETAAEERERLDETWDKQLREVHGKFYALLPEKNGKFKTLEKHELEELLNLQSDLQKETIEFNKQKYTPHAAITVCYSAGPMGLLDIDKTIPNCMRNQSIRDVLQFFIYQVYVEPDSEKKKQHLLDLGRVLQNLQPLNPSHSAPHLS